MAQLIATGTTREVSGDTTIAAGDSKNYALFSAAGAGLNGCRAGLEYKMSNGQYREFDELDVNKPTVIVDGPITLRVVRKASSISFGVDES